MQYRNDINGLRAIAVLAVVIFHFNEKLLPGGFLGVDVFFVISGFLISQRIQFQRDAGHFRLKDFYVARVRRILPTLLVVLAITACAAFLLLPSLQLKHFCQALVAQSLFASNIFFFLVGGYFAPTSSESALIHTWSLSVEEQFYCLFPLLFFIRGDRRRLILAVLCFGASLILMCFSAARRFDEFGFYILLTRAWEFLAGYLAAELYEYAGRVSTKYRRLLLTIGVLCILISLRFSSGQGSFPVEGIIACVTGSSFVLIFYRKEGVASWLLENRVFVAIGMVSFSLYLWHQPVLAITRAKIVGSMPIEVFVIAVISVCLLTFASYHLVEKPYRNVEQVPQKALITRCGVVSFILLCFGLAGHYFDGFRFRFDATPIEATIQSSPWRAKCHTYGSAYLMPIDACVSPGEVKWAVLGDSHAVELSYALAAKLNETVGGAVKQLSFSGCPPARLFELDNPGCTDWLQDAVAYLGAESNIENVVVVFRYSSFIFGEHSPIYPSTPQSPILVIKSANGHTLSDSEALALYEQSVLYLVKELRRLGKNVYLVNPIPELPAHIHKMLTPISMLHRRKMPKDIAGTSTDYYFKRNAFALNMLSEIEKLGWARVVSVHEVICSTTFCYAVKANKALYFDDNHLSLAGAELVAEKIIAEYQGGDAIK